MEDFACLQDPATTNGSATAMEEEKEKMRNFVFKSLREVTDVPPLMSNGEGSALMEHRMTTRNARHAFKAHYRIKQGAVFSGKILSFGCSVCKDNCTYSPNDLLKHFRAAHRGTLPTYPCDLCDFATHEFSALQRHRMEHRNTLVTCELCDDNIQYSLLLITRHYIMSHSTNGQFICDWCEFTTTDAGTFVQHIHHHNECHWKCSKCRHISLNEKDHKAHAKGHSDKFPFTCQTCGFGATSSEKLKKHKASVHKSVIDNAWKFGEDASSTSNFLFNLKQPLRKLGESLEAQKALKPSSVPGGVPIQNGRLLNVNLPAQETRLGLEATTVKKDSKVWAIASQNAEQTASVLLQECENASGTDAGSHTNPNGLTVLMVKNKISLPPNCTTKMMGFKVVDGKKHLVLKVIPAGKQDPTTKANSATGDVFSLAQDSEIDKNTFSENRESSDKGSSNFLAISPKSSFSMQINQDDVMAVKVKVEEEETSVCNIDSVSVLSDVGDPIGVLHNFPLTTAETTTRAESSQVKNQINFNKTSCSNTGTNLTSVASGSFAFSQSVSKTSDSKLAGRSSIDESFPSSLIVQEALNPKVCLRKCVESSGAPNVSAVSGSGPVCSEGSQEGSAIDTVPSSQTSSEKSKRGTQNSDESDHENANGLKLSLRSSRSALVTNGEFTSEAGNATQNTPNQEVFTFHNYSKETFTPSPVQPQNADCHPAPVDCENAPEESHFSLMLAASPEYSTEVEIGESVDDVEDPLNEENPESVLQDFNIVKVEDDIVPICAKQPELTSGSIPVTDFVEEHSDMIITQQLNKEKAGHSGLCADSSKQAKTVQILQLPDGQQSIVLTPATPAQVKGAPTFKVLTNSTSPQINVSYRKSAAEKLGKPPIYALTPTGSVMELPATTSLSNESRSGLAAAVKPGATTPSNHFLINSSGFKGSVLVSSGLQNTHKLKVTKRQPTCFFVQRSVPVQSACTPALKMSTGQLPVNQRPVLAVPVNSAEKPGTLPAGRQAFLLRYISPKSGVCLSNQEARTGTISNQTGENTGNKVILKLLSPTNRLHTSAPSTSSGQPLFLATRPQSKCFLVASNKGGATAYSGVKKLISFQNPSQKDVKSNVSPSQISGKSQPGEAEKQALAPRSIRPPSQRKRCRKILFDEIPATVHKARRVSNKSQTEKETPLLWTPVAKDSERTLRLAPFNSVQPIKCPRRYQPVVVLNHPDVDIPEVANIMKVVKRHKGAVTKVALAQKTLEALSKLGDPEAAKDAPPRPIQSSVRERYLLKMKLRKKSKRKYQVVKTLSSCAQGSGVFSCWFCGRLFNNQEDWIGHGQRHLMEATRDWNNLF